MRERESATADSRRSSARSRSRSPVPDPRPWPCYPKKRVNAPTDENLDRPATSDSTARALVAAIPDPIFRIGTQTLYRGFKVDSAEHLLTSPDEVIGRSVHERLPGDVADAVLAAGRRAVEEGVLQNIEYTLEVQGETRTTKGAYVACGADEFVFIVRD